MIPLMDAAAIVRQTYPLVSDADLRELVYQEKVRAEKRQVPRIGRSATGNGTYFHFIYLYPSQVKDLKKLLAGRIKWDKACGDESGA